MNHSAGVPHPTGDALRSRYVQVDGIRTHYLEAGEGDTVVLLHSGEFGGRAEFSWEYLMPLMAGTYRVVAPDWLGFGGTDKIHDFGGKRARMISHMRRTLDVLDVGDAHMVGNSMGATHLAQMASETGTPLRAKSISLISGGGFAPDNEARRATLEYDCTRESMTRLMRAIFVDPVWWEDEAYGDRRQIAATEPGAWESLAVSRFKSPIQPVRTGFGQPDQIRYEKITCPTLFVVGAQDALREPGYAEAPASQIRNARIRVVESAGHCANIEKPFEVFELLQDFFHEVEGAGHTVRHTPES